MREREFKGHEGFEIRQEKSPLWVYVEELCKYFSLVVINQSDICFVFFGQQLSYNFASSIQAFWTQPHDNIFFLYLKLQQTGETVQLLFNHDD